MATMVRYSNERLLSIVSDERFAEIFWRNEPEIRKEFPSGSALWNFVSDLRRTAAQSSGVKDDLLLSAVRDMESARRVICEQPTLSREGFTPSTLLSYVTAIRERTARRIAPGRR